MSTLTRYYDCLVQYARLNHDRGVLFDLVDCPRKTVAAAGDPLSGLHGPGQRCAVLLNGNFNHSLDIQGLLRGIRGQVDRHSRLIAVLYNPYFAPVYRLANRLGLRAGPSPSTFVTRTDLENIARLSGFHVVRTRSVVYSPLRLLGLGTLANRILPAVPLLRHLHFAQVVVLAANLTPPPQERPSISVIVPTRNERGNIEAALDGLREVSADLPGLEVVFVEGHSNDGTWDEIQRLMPRYASAFKISAYQQTGTGKGDAVRLGFGRADVRGPWLLDAIFSRLERHARYYAWDQLDWEPGVVRLRAGATPTDPPA
jgi:hypothetical protein